MCLVAVAACVSAACGVQAPTRQGEAPASQSPSPSLTVARAQAAVSEWVDGPTGPSRDGAAMVVAVRETNGTVFAAGDLRVKAFPDVDGHTSPTEDPAEAVFSRQNDGSWVLSSVVWDFGRRTASPDVPVR